jgi:threonine synthase
MPQGVLSRYKAFLPVTAATPVVTLGEGNTPLVRSRHLEADLGIGELYFKLESCNPTGSFKDRGMVVAVAKALEEGSRGLLCASTGNTSASAAAFGAACGLPVVVVIPKGAIALGKLAQAQAYGARVVVIRGNFDDALQVVRVMSSEGLATLVNSVNPYRLEGQKTAAFEIVDELGDAPDYLCIPVGNAGNITAYWRGFREYREADLAKRTPRMMGFQAEDAAPLVRGFPIGEPRTVASAIRIGNPANWQGAIMARDESEGAIDSVTDEQILAAGRLLARQEGIFAEPASAASLAGLVKLVEQGFSLSEKRVVCIITGSGLKDPDAADRYGISDPDELPADPRAVASAISHLF